MRNNIPVEYLDRVADLLVAKFQGAPKKDILRALKISPRAAILVGRTWMQARESGFHDGYHDGYRDGEQAGYQNGFDNGYVNGGGKY